MDKKQTNKFLTDKYYEWWLWYYTCILMCRMCLYVYIFFSVGHICLCGLNRYIFTAKSNGIWMFILMKSTRVFRLKGLSFFSCCTVSAVMLSWYNLRILSFLSARFQAACRSTQRESLISEKCQRNRCCLLLSHHGRPHRLHQDGSGRLK